MAMYTCLWQALPRVLIHLTQVGRKEEMEVASTVQPFKEEPRESNKDFDQD